MALSRNFMGGGKRCRILREEFFDKRVINKLKDSRFIKELYGQR